MDFTRIRSVIDVDRMQASRVSLFGAGGSAGLACDLVRCGLGAIDLTDPQTIEPSNLARQDHTEVGALKVKALERRLQQIEPAVKVRTHPRDFTAMTDMEIEAAYGGSNLLVFATDAHRAQARGNQIALKFAIPALFIGLYGGAGAGEVIWWTPEKRSCFRCIASARFVAQERAARDGRGLDPGSDGADILSVHYLDAVAGQLAVGILTRGSANRFGRLCALLGDRQCIQVKVDPGYTLRGRDLFREQLGIDEGCSAYFSWNAIARSDPDDGEPPCPDCVQFRGRRPALQKQALRA